MFSGGDGLFQIPAGGGTPTRLTTVDPAQGEAAHSYPELLPGGHAILFNVEMTAMAAPSDANVVIQVLETGERQVVVEGGSDPRYLDSGHIVFARTGTLMAVPFDPAGLEVTGEAVSVLEDLMQAQGGLNANLNSGAAQFSVSRQGRLAYAHGGIYSVPGSELVLVDHSGNATALPLPQGVYVYPRFSPDGTRLAYASVGDSKIWIYDIGLETSTPLTPQGSYIQPVWSPDSTRLAFVSGTFGAGGPTRNLFVMDADGSGEPERLTESDRDQAACSWSPDGTLAFLRRLNPGEPNDIWMLRMDGESEPEQFIEIPLNQQHASFSPDGNWLAYTSEESGSSEIYVRPYPDAEPAYKVSTEGGRDPVWSPDGKKLFYHVGPIGEIGVMVVDLTTESTFTSSQPSLLFEGPFVATNNVKTFDISPDGQHFVWARPLPREPQPVTEITIVDNWFEELRLLAPTAD